MIYWTIDAQLGHKFPSFYGTRMFIIRSDLFFSDMAMRSIVGDYECFGGTFCLQLQGRRLELAGDSKLLVSTYRSMQRRYDKEEHNLNPHRRDNLSCVHIGPSPSQTYSVHIITILFV
jgi:hypothetical protein